MKKILSALLTVRVFSRISLQLAGSPPSTSRKYFPRCGCTSSCENRSKQSDGCEENDPDLNSCACSRYLQEASNFLCMSLVRRHWELRVGFGLEVKARNPKAEFLQSFSAPFSRKCGAYIHSMGCGKEAEGHGNIVAFLQLCGTGVLQNRERQTLGISKRPRKPNYSLGRSRVQSNIGYVPSEEDRPESAPKVPTELTLAQELLLKQYEDQVERMSTKDCQELALEIARQMMVKDNILRTMLKKEAPFGSEPPDPSKFKESI